MPVESCPKRLAGSAGWDGLWTEYPMTIGARPCAPGAMFDVGRSAAEPAGDVV